MNWQPRDLASIPAAEKIAAFDDLYERALEHYRDVERDGNGKKDADHFMFEAVMNLLGDGVWQSYNKLLG